MERWLFGVTPVRLVAVLFAISVLRTGIWCMPNLELTRAIAENPFANPLRDPEVHYLVSSWLGPLLAWCVGATGVESFFLFHLAFSVGFVALTARLVLGGVPDRTARVALVTFFLVPVSGTAFFWVGMDSITLFLMASAFVFPRRKLWALVVGVALGMQHFEQGLVGAIVLSLGVALRRRDGEASIVPIPWCASYVAGVLVGKLALLRQLVGNLHALIWSVAGVAWLLLLRTAELGRNAKTLALLACVAVAVFCVAFDQTRVASIVTFPMFFVCWLQDRELLDRLGGRFVALLMMLWTMTPWFWVLGGEPEVSVLPHDLVFAAARLTGRLAPPESPF